MTGVQTCALPIWYTIIPALWILPSVGCLISTKRYSSIWANYLCLPFTSNEHLICLYYFCLCKCLVLAFCLDYFCSDDTITQLIMKPPFVGNRDMNFSFVSEHSQVSFLWFLHCISLLPILKVIVWLAMMIHYNPSSMNTSLCGLFDLS